MATVKIPSNFKAESYKSYFNLDTDYVAENIKEFYSYNFTQPKNTIYIKVFKFIAEKGYCTRSEIYKNLFNGRSAYSDGRGYKSELYTAAQIMGYFQRYRCGRHQYYTLTEKGYQLLKAAEN